MEVIYKIEVKKLFSPQKGFEIIHMDEFANELLHSEIFLNVTLPRIPKRNVK